MHRVLSRFMVFLIGTIFFSSVSFGACSGRPHQTGLPGYALSPDATRIAAIAEDGALFWWDVASGKRTGLMGCVTPEAFGHPILFSPDSKRLAVLVNGAVDIFDVASGSIVARLTSLKTHEINNITYSADGRRLAAGYHEGAIVWDVANQAELIAVPKQYNPKALALNSDGSSLALVGTDGIEIWTVAQPKLEPRIRLASNRSVESLLFVDGTQQLVALEATAQPLEPKQKLIKFKREVVLWDSVTGRTMKTFEGDPGELRFPLVSGNRNSLFAVDYENHLFVWDMNSGKLTATWDTPSGHPSLDGKLLLREGAARGELELWKIGSPDETAQPFVYKSPLCSESLTDSNGNTDFDLLFFADGFNEDDDHFSTRGYVAQDCTRLNLTFSYYKSAESAQRHFKQVETKAAEIVDTGSTKHPWQQVLLGPRTVVRLAGWHSWPGSYAVMWVEGSTYHEITSDSLAVALAFEKTYFAPAH